MEILSKLDYFKEIIYVFQILKCRHFLGDLFDARLTHFY